MTESDIDNMSSGIEIDRLVAEHIFGMVRCEGEGHENHIMSAVGQPPYYHRSWGGIAIGLPIFSIDMAAAWEVLMQLAGKYRASVHDISKDGTLWQCVLEIRDGAYRFPIELSHRGDQSANAETVPLAIYRAGLKAVLLKDST